VLESTTSQTSSNRLFGAGEGLEWTSRAGWGLAFF